MVDIKPTSFRVTTIATDKFKELASDLGMTQAEFFDNLISTFELENAKSKIIDRSKEIDEFQSHAQRIVSIYLNSLQLNQNSEERIKEKFCEQLQKKSDLIANLQDQLKDIKENINSFQLEKDAAVKKQIELEEINKQLQDTTKAKESLINEYKEKIDTLSTLVNEYKKYKDSIEKVKTELDKEKVQKSDFIYTIKDLELQNVNLNKQIKMVETNLLEHKQMLKEENRNNKNEILNIKKEYKENLKNSEKILKNEKEKTERTFEEKLSMEKEKFEIRLEKIELEKNKEIEELKKNIKKLEEQNKKKSNKTTKTTKKS